MERPRVDRVAIGELHHLAQVHHRDPVAGVPDDREVVGDEQVGQPEAVLEVAEQIEDLRPDRDVERGDRLIEDQERRVEGEGPGDPDPLALAARELVGEGWLVHDGIRGGEIRERASLLLARVGLPADAADRYPHEFSGGQRQRIGIARAIALRPKLVVADEPVSALDVSVQAQILNLLKDIQDEYGMAYLFVSHDLRVIRHVSDTVAVMYLGKLMEVSPAGELFREPLHPYSRSLLSAVPMPGGAKREEIVLRGEIPSPISPPPGCRFHTRCFMAQKVCEELCPLLRESAPGRFTACHFV